MTVILENEHIRVGINEHGAELSELVLKKTGANYLWSGDAKYWGRHAPVLFPTVGKLKNDEYSSTARAIPCISTDLLAIWTLRLKKSSRQRLFSF